MGAGRFAIGSGTPEHSPDWSRWSAITLDRRRIVVAVLVGASVLCGLSAIRPAPTPTKAVWVAARDLSGGSPLAAADLVSERLAVSAVPHDALTGPAPIGHLLAAPIRRGEPLTDVRLLSTQLMSALGTPGSVAVPIRVADGAATAAVVHAGDRVDVIATADPANGGPPHAGTVASGVRVLAVPAAASDAADGAATVVIAASPAQAAALASAQAGDRLSVAVDSG